MVNFLLRLSIWMIVLAVGLPRPSTAQARLPLHVEKRATIQAQPQDRRFDPILRKMQERTTDGSATSIAVAVAVAGKIVWEEASGWADRERGVRATPYTPYKHNRFRKHLQRPDWRL